MAATSNSALPRPPYATRGPALLLLRHQIFQRMARAGSKDIPDEVKLEIFGFVFCEVELQTNKGPWEIDCGFAGDVASVVEDLLAGYDDIALRSVAASTAHKSVSFYHFATGDWPIIGLGGASIVLAMQSQASSIVNLNVGMSLSVIDSDFGPFQRLARVLTSAALEADRRDHERRANELKQALTSLKKLVIALSGRDEPTIVGHLGDITTGQYADRLTSIVQGLQRFVKNSGRTSVWLNICCYKATGRALSISRQPVLASVKLEGVLPAGIVLRGVTRSIRALRDHTVAREQYEEEMKGRILSD